MNKSVFTQKITVTPQMTASAMGSGILEVLSTPSLCAVMENTAIRAVSLDEGETSVGAEINIEHLRASQVGEVITVKAEVKAHEGHSIYFSIEAKNEQGDVIGRASHTRVVVNAQRFMSRFSK